MAGEARTSPWMRVRYRLTGFPGSPWAQSGRHLLWFWLCARALVFSVWLIAFRSTQGDVIYYWTRLRDMAEVGPRETLVEYPTPVIWLLQVPYLLGGGTRAGYVVAFVVCMLALDAGFSWSMWRHGGWLRSYAVLFWTIFLLLVGPTTYLRFDLIPAVLAGWALLQLVKDRAGTAGMLIGAGAAAKLWPALMWPALAGMRKKHALRATVGVFGLGGLLALASLLWADWDRLLSPLTWQSGRALQVESIWATPVMLARIVARDEYWVGISSFQAFEIWGPGDRVMLALASASTVLGYLGIVALYVLWLRRPERRLIEAAALMLFVVLVIIVTNKTFSPQYIMWLGGPLAAGFAVAAHDIEGATHTRVDVRDRRRLVRMGWFALGLTLLTLLVYPVGYSPLVQGTRGMTAVTLVLAVRNVGVVALLVWNLVWIASFLRPGTGADAAKGRSS